jgi:hypothetical protein
MSEHYTLSELRRCACDVLTLTLQRPQASRSAETSNLIITVFQAYRDLTAGCLSIAVSEFNIKLSHSRGES